MANAHFVNTDIIHHTVGHQVSPLIACLFLPDKGNDNISDMWGASDGADVQHDRQWRRRSILSKGLLRRNFDSSLQLIPTEA